MESTEAAAETAVAAAINSGVQGRIVTRSTFVRFIRDSFGVVAPGLLRVVDRVFEMLDTNKQGALPWNELFVALARVAGGTLAQRAAFYFSMCDTNGRGLLNASQVKAMVRHSAAVAEETRVHAHEVLEALLGPGHTLDDDDAAGSDLVVGDVRTPTAGGPSGTVTRTQFREAVERYPSLLACFSMVFGVDPNHVPAKSRAPYVWVWVCSCARLVL